MGIVLDLKDERLPPVLPSTVPLAWTAARMDALDREIRSVFRRRELMMPDDVRGNRRSLRVAVRRDGWPTLARTRGKVMFVMANREPYRSRYLAGHPSLRNRVLFTNSKPTRPDAAFIEANDPRGAGARRIRRLVHRGFLVRTRADADTVEARVNDTARARRALASGAQWVSTDTRRPGWPRPSAAHTSSSSRPAGSRAATRSPPRRAALSGWRVEAQRSRRTGGRQRSQRSVPGRHTLRRHALHRAARRAWS